MYPSCRGNAGHMFLSYCLTDSFSVLNVSKARCSRCLQGNVWRL